MAEFNGAALSGELLMTTQIALSRKISVDVHYPQVFKGLRDAGEARVKSYWSFVRPALRSSSVS